MSNSTLFEEPLVKDPEEEVVTALRSVYGDAVTKKVLDLLRDSTPFQMAVAVLPYPFFASLPLFFFFIIIIIVSHSS